MSRAYSYTKCWLCGKIHSSNGFAKINHMRKHVREGKLVEKQDRDGYYSYEKVKEQQP